MAKAKKKKGKKTIDLTLRLNVELEQGKQKPRKERVKRITSRKRQNLREMRRGMGRRLKRLAVASLSSPILPFMETLRC